MRALRGLKTLFKPLRAQNFTGPQEARSVALTRLADRRVPTPRADQDGPHEARSAAPERLADRRGERTSPPASPALGRPGAWR